MVADNLSGEGRLGRRVPGEGAEGRLVARTRTGITGGGVRLLDVSITGALIEAALGANVNVGSQVHVEFGQHQGSAVVRRIVPAETSGHWRYGIEFVSGDLPDIAYDTNERTQQPATESTIVCDAPMLETAPGRGICGRGIQCVVAALRVEDYDAYSGAHARFHVEPTNA
jgi:PilZ domain